MSPTGRQVATTFAGHLINDFPPDVIAEDTNGCLPFFTNISDWIDWANNQEKQKDEYTARPDYEPDKSAFYPGSSSKNLYFPRVEIWGEVEWCYSMISAELDVLARNLAMPTFQRTRRSLMKRDERSDDDNIPPPPSTSPHKAASSSSTTSRDTVRGLTAPRGE
jgi:hypothetical protein